MTQPTFNTYTVVPPCATKPWIGAMLETCVSTPSRTGRQPVASAHKPHPMQKAALLSYSKMKETCTNAFQRGMMELMVLLHFSPMPQIKCGFHNTKTHQWCVWSGCSTWTWGSNWVPPLHLYCQRHHHTCRGIPSTEVKLEEGKGQGRLKHSYVVKPWINTLRSQC